ncbi:Protein of unknown function [Gryllus bimaculatus]|nr:Protein of unknown function [Gryllus bimaculatus]
MALTGASNGGVCSLKHQLTDDLQHTQWDIGLCCPSAECQSDAQQRVAHRRGAWRVARGAWRVARRRTRLGDDAGVALGARMALADLLQVLQLRGRRDVRPGAARALRDGVARERLAPALAQRRAQVVLHLRLRQQLLEHLQPHTPVTPPRQNGRWHHSKKINAFQVLRGGAAARCFRRWLRRGPRDEKAETPREGSESNKTDRVRDACTISGIPSQHTQRPSGDSAVASPRLAAPAVSNERPAPLRHRQGAALPHLSLTLRYTAPPVINYCIGHAVGSPQCSPGSLNTFAGEYGRLYVTALTCGGTGRFGVRVRKYNVVAVTFWFHNYNDTRNNTEERRSIVPVF